MNHAITHKRTSRNAVGDDWNAKVFAGVNSSFLPKAFAWPTLGNHNCEYVIHRASMHPTLSPTPFAFILPFAAVFHALHRSFARKWRNLLVPRMAPMSSLRRRLAFARARTTVEPHFGVFGLCYSKLQLGFSLSLATLSIPYDQRLGLRRWGEQRHTW